MKERYAQQPAEGFTIDVAENVAVITFRENCTLIEATEEGEIWEADKYVITAPCRENLSTDVEVNYDVWLAAAIAAQVTVYAPGLEEQVEAQAKAIEDLAILVLGGGS